MTIDVVKEEQLCSLGDEAEALLKTEAFEDVTHKVGIKAKTIRT